MGIGHGAIRRGRHALGALVLSLALLPAGAGAQGLAGDYLAARQAALMGDYVAAARYYDNALRQEPDVPDFLERAAWAHMALGDVERAEVLGQRILEQGLTSQIAQMAVMAERLNAEDYAGALDQISRDRGVGPLVDGLVTAWAELGRGDMTAALLAFDEVAATEGLAPFAAYHKALALASVGDFEGALEIFDTQNMGGLNLTRRGLIARAQILSQLDRGDDAVALLDRGFAAEMDPELGALRDALEAGETVPFTYVRNAKDGMAETFYALAGAMQNSASEDYMLLYARVAEHLRPGFTDAILMVAEILESVEQHDLAVEAFKRVPPEDPAYHAAELGRAAALQASNKTDAAIEVLDRLTETHGDLPVVHSTLADALRREDRYAEAIESYTRALELFDAPDRQQWFLYYARGISHERLSHWDEAESDLRAALELNPDQPQVLNYLGYSLVEQQRKLEEALSMIERAVAAEPDSGYIVDSLGWVLYRLGRYDEAVGHMERAAEMMPIDPVVNDHLGDVYWAVGRKLEAEFMWKRALSFVDYENVSEGAEPDRIRRKLEVGLDQVLAEEGAPPLDVATDAAN